MYPGEYIQPLIRKHFINCPVVSGYVAARLQAEDWFQPTVSGSVGLPMLVTYANVGGTAFSVLLRETSDRSISGTRYSLTAPRMVVPGGQATEAVSGGMRPYLEVFCTGTTTGNLHMQIDSQRQWRQLGFDRTDPFYPVELSQAKEYPGWTT
jgi:hypothetical protein